MYRITLFISFILIILLTGCDPYNAHGSPEEINVEDSYAYSSSDGSTDQGNDSDESGLITAGEWNDLDNWIFWRNLFQQDVFSSLPDYWNFYPSNRVSVIVQNNDDFLTNVSVELLKNTEVVWEAKTDNFGKAEMWIDLFHTSQPIDITDYSLRVNGQSIQQNLKLYPEGINEINLNVSQNTSLKVELSFIVDATGSMGDELEFLKDDLRNVIQRVQENNSSLQIYTSSVFYRDNEDDYITRHSNFTNNINTTLDFINEQSAEGGGDYPEAVHSALKIGIDELQWSEEAKIRLAFLLLDAPPHHNAQVIDDMQKMIQKAAEKGIKIIPITASGIDKETEFLMRTFAIATNGTYVFITNHSGIGEDHIEASVGEYEVEYLNDLMVRLINKYSE